MKFDITVNDPLLEPFLPVIRRRHERSVLKELEFTNRKKRLADIFNNHLYLVWRQIVKMLCLQTYTKILRL